MKKISKLFSVILCLALLIGGAGCAAQTTQQTGQQQAQQGDAPGAADEFVGEILLGQVVTSLTGEAAMYGHFMVNAAQMAVEEINAAGGVLGKRLRIVYFDDQAMPQIALQAAQRLISDYDPVAILGADWSGNTLAMMQLTQDYGIPQLTSSKARRITHEGSEYIFRFVSPGHFVGQALAEFAQEQGHQRIAIFHTNTEYGISGGEGARRHVEALGMEVVAIQPHNSGDTDFTSQIMNVRESNADVLISYSIQVEGAASLRQLRELGVDIPVLGGCAFITPGFRGLVGYDVMEGVVAAGSFVPTAPNPRVASFVEAYQARFNMTPYDHASPYYDMVFILAEAIERAGSLDRTAIRDELRNTTGFIGVQGEYNYDGWGNMLPSTMVAVFENGNWRYIRTLTGQEDYFCDDPCLTCDRLR